MSSITQAGAIRLVGDALLSVWVMGQLYADAVDAHDVGLIEKLHVQFPQSLVGMMYAIGRRAGDMRGRLKRPAFRQLILSYIDEPSHREYVERLLTDDTFLDTVVKPIEDPR